ncbi:MAG: esterase-like activity of phytase family protein [Campylobacterales bacterium]|nr:esterase-like activity of phytase family protein [Campylobacterales bacterium]
MKKHFSYLLLISSLLDAGIFPVNITPSPTTQFEHIRILDQKELVFDKIGGIKFAEISDLAYQSKNEQLYLLSDQGKLFVFKAVFSNRIDRLEPLSGINLTQKNGREFKHWQRDSEGLAIGKKDRLLISFEGEPKISTFDAKGRMIYDAKLLQALKKQNAYRSPNKALEAVAWHPLYGILTASEWPVKKDDKKLQSIYSLRGKTWHLKAEPEAKSGITAIEVMDDGNILVLERSYIGLFDPFVVTLKKVYLNQCRQGICSSKVLLKMNSHKGWSIDNFEGLAKVGDHRYVVISDNQENFFQKTLLIYFEALD